MFVDIVRQNSKALQAAAAEEQQHIKGTRPADLPVYGQESLSSQ